MNYDIYFHCIYEFISCLMESAIINDYFADLMSRSSLQGSSIALLPEDNEDSKTAALMR